jgi:hypothetical protein
VRRQEPGRQLPGQASDGGCVEQTPSSQQQQGQQSEHNDMSRETPQRAASMLPSLSRPRFFVSTRLFRFSDRLRKSVQSLANPSGRIRKAFIWMTPFATDNGVSTPWQYLEGCKWRVLPVNGARNHGNNPGLSLVVPFHGQRHFSATGLRCQKVGADK